MESCVPLDQYNKRFGEIDSKNIVLCFLNRVLLHLELLYEHQQNYLSPPAIEIPYYLCIRTSIQSYDIPSLHARQYKHRSEINTDDDSKEKPLEHEYWFAVPKEK